ncbi:HTH domain-containing protein [Mycobacterium antarcticum]|uniref:HTH domain-containing protein n=1 Tax=Mycolicibacterium sp. TUM20985 TaxID=3023370 RepID=UPI002572FCDB|nr:HTH domain-containing protein [Mycolicibacterium sp. TUM20985]
MRRAERLYALVDLLRGSRRPLSAARLSEEFEVSKRTIELASSPSSLRGFRSTPTTGCRAGIRSCGNTHCRR